MNSCLLFGGEGSPLGLYVRQGNNARSPRGRTRHGGHRQMRQVVDAIGDSERCGPDFATSLLSLPSGHASMPVVHSKKHGRSSQVGHLNTAVITGITGKKVSSIFLSRTSRCGVTLFDRITSCASEHISGPGTIEWRYVLLSLVRGAQRSWFLMHVWCRTALRTALPRLVYNSCLPSGHVSPCTRLP